MDAVSNRPYLDMCHRKWPAQKLDALLAQPDVYQTVSAAVSFGLHPSGRFRFDKIEEYALTIRYRRKEPAALLIVLVQRYFETVGKRYLSMGTRAR